MPKISELTAAATLTGTEVFPIVQSSSTVKTSIDDIVTYVAAEPTISKSTGYLTWNGSAWVWKNETYALSSELGDKEDAISKSTGYLTWNGSAWVWKNETYVQTSQNNTYTKAQRGAFVALTSTSASIEVDLDDSNNFNHTLTEDTTLAAPTNAVAGQSGVIHLTQHASAPKTLAYNAFWKFAGGTVPTLTATNGAIDVLSYVVNPAGTSAVCVLAKDMK